MSAVQAAVLGVVQGLTEFLPVSSSAHLILVPRFLGWADQGQAYDVALHWGTLAALLAYYWRDWAGLFGAFLRDPRPEGPSRLLWSLALATLPAAVAGLALEHWIEENLRSPRLLAGSLAAFGLLLAAADRLGGRDRGWEALGWRGCLTIGAAQALALFPGVSRSGITLTAGLALGLRREEAARFSFLMAVPVTFAAAVLKARRLELASMDAAFWTGIVASGLAGAAAIAALLRLVRSTGLSGFAVYRVALAAVIWAVL